MLRVVSCNFREKWYKVPVRLVVNFQGFLFCRLLNWCTISSSFLFRELNSLSVSGNCSVLDKGPMLSPWIDSFLHFNHNISSYFEPNTFHQYHTPWNSTERRNTYKPATTHIIINGSIAILFRPGLFFSFLILHTVSRIPPTRQSYDRYMYVHICMRICAYMRSLLPQVLLYTVWCISKLYSHKVTCKNNLQSFFFITTDVRARVFNAGLLARSRFVSGRSCDRPNRLRLAMVFLGPRANAVLVPKFHVALHASQISLPIVTLQMFPQFSPTNVGSNFSRMQLL
jgi:hypothetical protein